MSDQDNNSGKSMSVDEKRELLKDMDISYTSKRVGDVDDAGNIIKDKVAKTVDEKRELLDDMEITYTSTRVGDVDEAGNIVKDKVAKTVEEKRESLDDMEITYTSKRVGDAVSDASSIEQQLKDKADSKITSNIEERASEKLGATAGGAAAGAYTAARNNASSQFVKAQQEAAKARAQAAAENKVGDELARGTDKITEKHGEVAGKAAELGGEKVGDISSEKLAGGLSSNSIAGNTPKESPISAAPSMSGEATPASTIASNPGNGDLISASDGDLGAGALADDDIDEDDPDSAPPPDKVAFAPNNVNKLVLPIGNKFTLKQLVDKLLEIEGSKGFEAARFTCTQLNYDAICDLAQVGHAKNDPNLMPSRFMLIPGADDQSLEAKGCLDDIPWPVHPDGPQKMSVAFLKQCLTLGGYSEGGKSVWASKDTDEEPNITENNSPEAFSDDLKAAFFKFLKDAQKQSIAPEFTQQTYSVKKGDSLSKIAKEHGYPSWHVLYEANRDSIENPDLIYPGQTLTLPALDNQEIEPWLTEKEAPNGINTPKAYHFPAQYFSMSLTEDDELITRETPWQFEAYTKEPPHRFYHFQLNGADQIKVMLPTSNNIAIGFYDEHYQNEELEIAPFSTIQNSQDSNTTSIDASDNPDQLIHDDLPLVNE